MPMDQETNADTQYYRATARWKGTFAGIVIVLLILPLLFAFRGIWLPLVFVGTVCGANLCSLLSLRLTIDAEQVRFRSLFGSWTIAQSAIAGVRSSRLNTPFAASEKRFTVEIVRNDGRPPIQTSLMAFPPEAIRELRRIGEDNARPV